MNNQWWKKLRAMLEELESYQPPTGLAKWFKLLSDLRVAGTPRAVAVLWKAVLLADFIVDAQVPTETKSEAIKCLNALKYSAALQEIVWLDDKQVIDFINRYRENDYRDLCVEWVENREENPNPYDGDLPSRLWDLIIGKSDCKKNL